MLRSRPNTLIVLAAILSGLVALALVAGAAIDDALCQRQMVGEGPSRPASNCGRPTSGAADEFRYSIDEGSSRILYLSGGSRSGPVAIRLAGRTGLAIEHAAHVLEPDRHIDVCRNQPPRDARGWNFLIDEETARAILEGRTADDPQQRSRLVLFFDGQAAWRILDASGRIVMRVPVPGDEIFGAETCMVTERRPQENSAWAAIDAATVDALVRDHASYRAIAEGIPGGEVALEFRYTGCRRG
jgi:hypothetical protein